jgi:hypothetical protein
MLCCIRKLSLHTYIRDKKEDNIRFSWKFPSPSSQIAHKLSASRERERQKERDREKQSRKGERHF